MRQPFVVYGVRRHRVRRAKDAVDDKGLAPDLGRDPAGKDRHEPGRAHHERRAVQPAPVVKPALQPREAAEEPQRQHRKPDPDHQPERPEHHRHRRPHLARHAVQPRHRRVHVVLEDQRAEPGDADRVVQRPGFHVGQPEQVQRRAVGMAFEMPLHRHDLVRLVFQRVQPVLVAREDLDRRDQQQHPHRHREHDAAFVLRAAAQHVPGGAGPHHQRGGEIGGQHHVDQPVGQRGVEDDRPPVARQDPACLVHDVALRGLHPAVDRQDPERRDQRAHRDRVGGECVQAAPDAVGPEQHDAQEPGLKEERRHHLVCHQRPDHRPRKLAEPRPVGAELVGHDDARHDAHAEGDGEHAHPVFQQVVVNLAVGNEPQRLEHRDEAGKADGEGREHDVERHREGELQAGQQHGVKLFEHRPRTFSGREKTAVAGPRCPARRPASYRRPRG